MKSLSISVHLLFVTLDNNMCQQPCSSSFTNIFVTNSDKQFDKLLICLHVNSVVCDDLRESMTHNVCVCFKKSESVWSLINQKVVNSPQGEV